MHSKRPIIIAHRGANREAPENTLSAFEHALELGADGIEFDVLLTSDKIPVVTHNDNLSALTDHKGHVRSTSFEEIRSLDFGSHFDESFNGTKIPTLEEVLDLVKDHDILTNVEIKAQHGFNAESAQIVGETVSRFKMKGPRLLSSTNIHILHELQKLFPDIPRGIILIHPAFSFLIPSASAKLGLVSAIHPVFNALSKKLLENAHNLGCSVNVWTINDEAKLDECLKLGVDGVFTDDVKFVKEFLNNSSATPRK